MDIRFTLYLLLLAATILHCKGEEPGEDDDWEDWDEWEDYTNEFEYYEEYDDYYEHDAITFDWISCNAMELSDIIGDQLEDGDVCMVIDYHLDNDTVQDYIHLKHIGSDTCMGNFAGEPDAFVMVEKCIDGSTDIPMTITVMDSKSVDQDTFYDILPGQNILASESWIQDEGYQVPERPNITYSSPDPDPLDDPSTRFETSGLADRATRLTSDRRGYIRKVSIFYDNNFDAYQRSQNVDPKESANFIYTMLRTTFEFFSMERDYKVMLDENPRVLHINADLKSESRQIRNLATRSEVAANPSDLYIFFTRSDRKNAVYSGQGTICDTNPARRMVIVPFFGDGTFTSEALIHVTGHLMGLHDDFFGIHEGPNSKRFSLTDGKNCKKQGGYMNVRKNKHKFTFCSLEDLDKILRTKCHCMISDNMKKLRGC